MNIAQVAEVTPDHTAAVITAIGAALAAVLGAIGTITVRRSARSTRAAAQNIGVTNGQGTLATMVARIDTTTQGTNERVQLIDERLTDHQNDTARRFEALQAALALEREHRERLAGRLSGYMNDHRSNRD